MRNPDENDVFKISRSIMHMPRSWWV